MSGANTPLKQNPPAAPQPPAPVAQQSQAQQQTAPEAPSPVAGVTLLVNGAEVTDLAAVQAHITGLEAFKRETIEGGRKAFVAQLAKDGKIMANQESLDETEAFALSLSSEQFEAWKKSMGSSPANALFNQHGNIDAPREPRNGGSASEVEARIATLEEIVQAHRDAGVPENVIETKASYKELQKLTSSQAR